MAKAKYKHFSLMVPDGGNLIAGSNSSDTAGANNYTAKINFRRETDGEVRREGWSRLYNGDQDVSRVSDPGDYPIRLLHQFESEGQKVLVAASADKLYRLDDNTSQWNVIAEGLWNLDKINYNATQTQIADQYGLEARRWEVVVIDGYIIFNNGVDIPLFYRADWPCAFPLFSLRERGIVRVGTISEFDGRLFIADVEYFDETIENNFTYFMGGAAFPYDIPEYFADYDDYITTYTVPHIIEFSAWRLADDQREARSAPNLFGQSYVGTVHSMSNGAITAVSLDYTLGGTRDTSGAGMESYVHNPFFSITGDAYNALDFDHSTFISGDSLRMTVTDTNGVVKVYDADVTSINSNWLESKTFVSLQSSYNNTSTGVLTNTGDEQSTATHNVAVGDKVEFILLKEPDVFSTNLAVVREASDSIAFPEDGSRIIKMTKLGDKLMVHRQTGHLAISRGDKYTAFYYEERYKGERVADFRHTVINIDDQRQMFTGYNGTFFITHATTEPTPLPQFMNGPEFWRLVSQSDSEYVYATENPLTQEVFVAAPIGYKNLGESNRLDWGCMAFDLLFGTLSQIDFSFTAMCSLFPTSKSPSRSFLMGSHIVQENPDGTTVQPKYTGSEAYQDDGQLYIYGGSIVKYGYGSGEGDQGPYREFARDGKDYACTLKFGKADLGDKFSEKKMRSYALHMSDIFDYRAYMSTGYIEDDYVESAIIANVTLSTFSTTQETEIEEVEQVLDDLSSEVMIPVYAQGNYFQDVITLTGVDKPFKVLGRTLEVSGVRTKMTSEVVSGS